MPRVHRLRAALLVPLGALAALASTAEPLAREEVPEPLAPWVDWVLRGHEVERCPFLHGLSGARVCLWPARLDLALDAAGGRFSAEVFADAEGFVALPGDAAHWPQQVLVDGAAAALVEGGGSPRLRLARGAHRVEGRFVWPALPQLLAVPPDAALVALSVAGRPVEFPVRDAAGRLWLGGTPPAAAGEESRVEVEVHRRAADEVPLRLTTQIELRVAGPAREVVLGPALPVGFAPLALASTLPARIESDGRLRVQLQPGRFGLLLEARSEGPAAEIGPPARAGAAGASPAADLWDGEEIWVFDARPALRLVDVTGGTPVDPQQTLLPEEWKALPAFRLLPGETLRLVERRRGDAEPAPDRLEIVRSVHLDFDGRGATVSDRIQGVVRASSRLELGESSVLGRAAVNGVEQFVTQRAGAARAGFELPRGAVSVEADLRVESGGRLRRLPAVGWEQDFASAAGELELPPGWRLFHASGVDRADSTWLNRWTLLDLFVVLVVGMALLRLWGRGWGALALATLVLTYTEPGAPRGLWLAVAVAEALRRVVRPGRLGRAVALYRAAALAALVLVAVPFAVSQVRTGLFPALEQPWALEPMPEQDHFGTQPGAPQALPVPAAEPPANAPEALRSLGYVVGGTASDVGTLEGKVSVAKQAPSRYAAYPDPTARLTTGPGVPSWRWETVGLTWSGPVERTQELHLILVPPLANLLLALLRTALLGLLVLHAFGSAPERLRRWLTGGRAAAALLALAITHAPAPARAELPPPELLDELRSRLLEPPACQPECASIPRLLLELQADALTARLEVHADAETAVPLPGGARDWVPGQVLVDGRPAAALWRASEGGLWVRLGPGAHQILVEGALPPRETLELPLPLLPRRVEVRATGWLVQGVAEDGSVEGALRLVRVGEAERTADARLEPSTLPPFVRVERTLELGLAWQAQTRVARLSPADAAVLLEVPLLEGESVTTAGVRVEGGRAVVSLGPGVYEAGWSSLLNQRPTLALAAPAAVPWTELWRVEVSPVWHVEATGIPALQAEDGGRLREWQPWPGERVELSVERPEGVAGSTLTVDAVVLEARPGLRASDASLSLVLRSSQGGPHVLRLPEGAELQSLAVDGSMRPVRQQGREVTLALVPGTQSVELVFREPRGIAARFRGPELDLGLPSVNVQLRIAMPPSRWILATGGPRLGPAVLFWPLLAVLVPVAFLLGRVPLAPLRFRHWLLLGLGLTQVPVAAAALVVVWLLALGWREREGTRLPGRTFDLLQVALVLLSAAALCVLFLSIRRGLLGEPEMQIAGNGSSAALLRWYQDRSLALLPRPWVFSAPLLVYRLAMLAWALWLAQALVRWLRWAWGCFSAGELWRPLRAPRVRAAGS